MVSYPTLIAFSSRFSGNRVGGRLLVRLAVSLTDLFLTNKVLLSLSRALVMNHRIIQPAKKKAVSSSVLIMLSIIKSSWKIRNLNLKDFLEFRVEQARNKIYFYRQNELKLFKQHNNQSWYDLSQIWIDNSTVIEAKFTISTQLENQQKIEYR